jgi:glutaconate CoA-transferase, subunit A
MIDKTTTLSDAARLIQKGQTLGLGGMTNYRRPMAFVRALIQSLVRQPAPSLELTLLTFTSGLESDFLVGTGQVKRTRTCYFGLEIFGLAPMFTQAASMGTIEIIEESEASIAFGLRATMARVGFMPSLAWQGTDMLRLRPDVKSITDPYTGHILTAFPAIGCDVAVIHTLEAARNGDCIFGGNRTIDLELATVARQVIITAEKVVDELAGPIDIPGYLVSHVIHTPLGAWPTSCFPTYPVDGEEILRYIAACNAGEFDSYILSHQAGTACER